ncbi:MAG: outer membrane protein [Candidatus Brocadiia bacterium]
MKRIVALLLALAVMGYFGCGAYAQAQQPATTTTTTTNTEGGAAMGSGMVAAGSERIAILGAANYGDVAGDIDAYAAIFAIAGEYGYMVCDQFEMAARAMVALAQVGTAGADVRLQEYSIVFIPKWRIPMEGNISPYIGPKAGAAYVTASGAAAVAVGGKHGGNTFHDAVFIWGAVAGADIFLSKQTSLFVEYDYTQFKLNGSDLGGGSIRVRDNGITAGLAYWW